MRPAIFRLHRWTDDDAHFTSIERGEFDPHFTISDKWEDRGRMTLNESVEVPRTALVEWFGEDAVRRLEARTTPTGVRSNQNGGEDHA